MKVVLLTNLAATLLMTGIIWFVQIIHYPLFNQVGEVGFAAYEVAHTRLTTRLVMPLMLIEATTTFLLLLLRPERVPLWIVWLSFGLLLLIWLSTAFWQVPQHNRLSTGFDAAAYQFLVSSNWLRTIAWSLRSFLLLWLVSRIIP